jgi:tetratricopeptide (TPR) repeat protein
MKKSILILLLAAVQGMALANDAYVAAMRTQISALNQAASVEDLQQVSRTLERIATAEPDKWHPTYYLAYAHLQLAMKEKDLPKRDTQLDRAMTWAEKSATISPNNSEVLALQGYILMMKLSVDPANRGQQLTPRTMQLLGQAMSTNPKNPRAYLLMGEMNYGTAQFFGSSTKEACGYLSKAQSLFAHAEPPADELAPQWGSQWAAMSTKKCEGN